jgi:hypothetical protein
MLVGICPSWPPLQITPCLLLSQQQSYNVHCLPSVHAPFPLRTRNTLHSLRKHLCFIAIRGAAVSTSYIAELSIGHRSVVRTYTEGILHYSPRCFRTTVSRAEQSSSATPLSTRRNAVVRRKNLWWQINRLTN